MQNTIVLSFFRNSRGVVVGDFSLASKDTDVDGEERLLATTHPATLAAALFAMDEYSFVLRTKKGQRQFEFPIDIGEIDDIASLLEDQDEGTFMTGFATFSRFDFANPAAWDNQADLHWRTAVHHLPKGLLKILPTESQPKGWKKELKNRNKYVYYPYC